MPEQSQFALPSPPEMLSRGSPHPTYEPALVDQEPPGEREDVEDFEIFSSTPLEEELTRDEASRAREAALGHGRVRELIGEPAPTDFGGSLVKAKSAAEPDLIRYSFFSCDTHRSAEVLLDRNSLDVLEVTAIDGQPAPMPEEVDRAVALAAAELGIDAASELVGRAIFVTRDDAADPLSGHRLADVRFGRPDERRPRVFALVDVCEDRVITTGELRRGRP
jgi:hypothetical protein